MYHLYKKSYIFIFKYIKIKTRKIREKRFFVKTTLLIKLIFIWICLICEIKTTNSSKYLLKNNNS